MIKPNWLPDMFSINPWTENTIAQLYKIFIKDFVGVDICYAEKPVWIFPEKEEGKEQLFWHLITRKDASCGERFPDFRRAERLPWARAVIDNALSEDVLSWDYEEDDGNIHTYLWLRNYDYLMIMKKYKNGSRRIVTAYWVEYENFKRKLEKKYKNKKANA